MTKSHSGGQSFSESFWDDKESVQGHQVDFVKSDAVHKLNVRPTLVGYLASIWERRHFILTDARYRAFRTTQDYRLWRFWLVASPLLDAVMYGVIFGLLLKTSRGIDNFVGYLVLGITFFSLLTSLVNSGTNLIQFSQNLIKAFAFPKATLVFSQALRYGIDTLPAAIVGVVFAMALQIDEGMHISTLSVIAIYCLIVLFGCGVMFFVAKLTFFIPDLKVIINMGIRGWFFASGIFFSIDRFATDPMVYQILTINPAHVFLEAIRQSVLYGNWPSWPEWGQMVGWSFGSLCIGLVYFWMSEHKYAEAR